MKPKFIKLILLALIITTVSAEAHKPWLNSSLAANEQIQLEKAKHFIKSGHPQKAEPIISSVLSSAASIDKCLAIASFTESYGYPLIGMRRKCLEKAVALCKSDDDYISVALKSRQYEFYEITRQCIDHLLENTNTVSDLFDLAHKAQEVTLNDIAHMAMEKAYTEIKTHDQAIEFAHSLKQMGMDDLVRKVIKDLINDQENSLALCTLLKNIESLDASDLNRYCLKKSLDKAQTVDDLKCIFEGARRNQQTDIMQVALYRGRKLILIEKIQHDQKEYAEKLQSWKQEGQQDLSEQHFSAVRSFNATGGKRFGDGNAIDSGF